MTAPPLAAPPARAPGVLSRLARPAVVFPLLLLVVALTAIVAPSEGVGNDARLTTLSTDPGGARGLHDSMRRLGWTVRRRTMPFDSVPSFDAVYVVMAPPVAYTASEAHRLLEAARLGAGVVVVGIQDRSALGDSLRLSRARRDGRGLVAPPPASPEVSAPLEIARCLRGDSPMDVMDVLTGERPLVTRAPLPAGAVTFAPVQGAGHPSASAIGFPLGRGRVVVTAGAALARNRMLAACPGTAGVRLVRMLEWAGAGHHTVVFDEYHQGYGVGGGAGAVGSLLVGSRPGRALLQLGAAGLLLLLALAARPLAPLARAQVERRSPLEHVAALAAAYERVGATRLVARRLARGLRRRHGGARRDDDEAFLRRAASRVPALAAPATMLLDATRAGVPPQRLAEVVRAAATIDTTLRLP